MHLPWNRPDLRPHVALVQRPVDPSRPGSGVTARFLGTGSLLLADDSGAVLADGFVTRPPAWRVIAGRITSDERRVREALRRIGCDRLDAVFCTHSHYDHALDAPAWARLTGADLVGSESTENIGRGFGLPETTLRVVGDGDALSYGSFTLTFLASEHGPPDRYPGTIDAPLTRPSRVSAYRSGGTFSVHIAHPRGDLVLHTSAGFRAGMLSGRRADTVYLGVAALGRQPQAQREQYWREVVETTDASRVVIVHWDDFFRALDRPLRPSRYLADDLDATLRWLLPVAERAGVHVAVPAPWQATDPFPPER